VDFLDLDIPEICQKSRGPKDIPDLSRQYRHCHIPPLFIYEISLRYPKLDPKRADLSEGSRFQMPTWRSLWLTWILIPYVKHFEDYQPEAALVWLGPIIDWVRAWIITRPNSTEFTGTSYSVPPAGHWHCTDSLADHHDARAVTVTVTESGSDLVGCPYCTGKSLAVPATVSHGPMSTVTRAFRVRVTGKPDSEASS
jgi:hypothetical protein